MVAQVYLGLILFQWSVCSASSDWFPTTRGRLYYYI